jgi:hypothetical protein
LQTLAALELASGLRIELKRKGEIFPFLIHPSVLGEIDLKKLKIWSSS